MTNRFARTYKKLTAKLGGRAKLALAIVGLWIALELAAAATIAIAGKKWLESDRPPAHANKGGSSALGLKSHSGPSLAVF